VGLKLDNTYIKNSYVAGSTNRNYIVGQIPFTANKDPKNVYWNKDVSGSESDITNPVSAEGLSTSEMQGSSASTNMDLEFGKVWETQNGDYPKLSWQE